MRHVVIIGANGQLGSDLLKSLDGFRVTGLKRADLEVRDPDQVRTVLTQLGPDVLINTSAFHKVDVCEDELEAAFAANATARELDSTLVHFSSDYVFDAESGALARRPEFSVLDHGRWKDSGFDELRPWRQALADYLQAKGHTGRGQSGLSQGIS